jgi:TRAP-type C4-dicarboxylate transport system permease small subunit
MMKFSWLERIVFKQALGGIAAITLLALMFITCVDVIGRYFANVPLIGAFESTEIGLALLIYAALPMLTLDDEHVRIDLLDKAVPQKWRRTHRLIVKIICVGVLALLTWALWRKAGSIATANMRTDSLHIPLGPVAYFMFAMSLLTFLSLAILVIAELRGHRRKSAQHQLGVE